MMQVASGHNLHSADALPEGKDNQADLRIFVFALFFVFGGITSLNDVLIPKLKDLFELSYAQVMLVQSAFFAAYFLISLPAAAFVRRAGYLRGAATGLSIMAIGCLLFLPAASTSLFIAFLGALFVLASGITTVQVVTNPLISMLGNPATAHSRLTFAQAFNSLGTTVFPYVGSILILGKLKAINPSALTVPELAAYRANEAQAVTHAYTGIAFTLTLLAALVWSRRHRLHERSTVQANILRAFDLLRRPRFAFGAACIFLYVGAEVAIGSIIVNFLERTDVLGLDELSAGKHVPYYWGGAMLGRFIGSWFLRQLSPGKILALQASLALLLLILSSGQPGAIAGWSLLAVGLCNSIMFPTIFSLASEGLGGRAPEGSGIICIMIVGGAIVPLITGHVADVAGLRVALSVPMACYMAILLFGIFARNPLVHDASS